jgi:hypothetical protein
MGDVIEIGKSAPNQPEGVAPNGSIGLFQYFFKNVFEYKNEKGFVILQLAKDYSLIRVVVQQGSRKMVIRTFENYFKALSYYTRRANALLRLQIREMIEK